jgi:exosortase A-associated hydrolase 2
LQRSRTEAFFLPRPDGYRFCILHAPSEETPVRGAILHVHPFAEEMNKSRRTVALGARAFANDGWAVLQADLCGCGDSSGDFGDATWRRWLDDVAHAYAWLEARYARAPLLWGLRLGALLASHAAADMASVSGLLLWQPVISGRIHLAQFLRLNVAGGLLDDGAARASTKELRDALARGESVEIAGYQLHPELALPMERAELEPRGPVGRAVWWCEVSPAGDSGLAIPSQTCAERLRKAGWTVRTHACSGLPFWQTQEIAECTALVELTRRLLAEQAP